jgi:hypothetical protein
MAICAAVALAATALTPLEGEAAGWIKFLDPPDENYYGDPDVPGGGSPHSLIISGYTIRPIGVVVMFASTGMVMIRIPSPGLRSDPSQLKPASSRESTSDD